MSAEQEQARVRALAEARTRLRHTSRPLEDRRKHAEEAIAFYKEKLIKEAEAQRETEALDLVQKLIELRARLTVIELEELLEEEVVLDPKKSERIVQHYHEDCLRLALATDRLLGIEHSL